LSRFETARNGSDELSSHENHGESTIIDKTLLSNKSLCVSLNPKSDPVVECLSLNRMEQICVVFFVHHEIGASLHLFCSHPDLRSMDIEKVLIIAVSGPNLVTVCWNKASEIDQESDARQGE